MLNLILAIIFSAMIPLALLFIGLVTGLAFYGGFYFYQKSVKENGVSFP